MLSRSLFRELKNMLDNIEKIQKNYLAQPPEWSEKDYKMVMFCYIYNFIEIIQLKINILISNNILYMYH